MQSGARDADGARRWGGRPRVVNQSICERGRLGGHCRRMWPGPSSLAVAVIVAFVLLQAFAVEWNGPGLVCGCEMYACVSGLGACTAGVDGWEAVVGLSSSWRVGVVARYLCCRPVLVEGVVGGREAEEGGIKSTTTTRTGKRTKRGPTGWEGGLRR